MFTRTLKTAALAAAVIVATAGASMAATYAWVDDYSKVKKFHENSSLTINEVYEGQKVKVIGQYKSWYKIQIPGKDGWVRANKLDFHNDWNDDWHGGHWQNGSYGGSFGGSFCVEGKSAQFCVGANY